MSGFALNFLIFLSLAFGAFAQTSYYVATNGSDANAGTLAAPFHTLTKAQSAEQSAGTGSVRTVYVRGGAYFNTTLLLSSSDNNTVWAGYPGDPPAVLYGGQPLTNWTASSNGWYVAALPAFPSSSLNSSVNEMTGWEVRMLLVDGAWAKLAQYPINGSSLTYSTSSTASQLIFTAGTVPTTLIASNADVEIDQSWNSEDVGLASINFSSDTMTFASSVSGGLSYESDIQTYRIYNTWEGMSTPGQFYFDRVNHLIYYYPLAGKNPNTSTVIVPTTDRIFYLEGALSGITFSNLSCMVAAADRETASDFGEYWDHLALFALQPNAGASHITWENCKLGWCGGNAIGGQCSYANNCSVINSEIGWCGAGGAALWWGPYNVVSNNYFHDTGILCYQAPAVGVNTNGVITQNNIFNCQQSAISTYDTDGMKVTYNSISNCMQRNEDMGAYYQFEGGGGSPGDTGSPSHALGNIIQSNLFQMVGTNFNVSGGICVNYYRPAMYFDQNSTNNLIADNITISCPTPVFFNVGQSNAIENCVFINTNAFPNYFGLMIYVDQYSANPYLCSNTVFYTKANYIIGNPGGPNYDYVQGTWQYWGKNIFYSTEGVAPQVFTYPFAASGQQANGTLPAGSTIADPQFTSLYPPLAYAATSPVLANGTVPLTFSQVPGGNGVANVSTDPPATITWSAPSAVTYGTVLSASQLDATANTPGTFVYSPALGSVLSAGSQTLSVTFTPSNSVLYGPATATVSLTVSPVPLTITASGASKVYGASLPALTASYAGFVNGDTAAGLTTAPTLASTASAGSPVGSYTVTAAGAADPNYTMSYVSGTLTVTTAPLTVTANNQTMALGGPLPALTGSYSGFVNGDTAAKLSPPCAMATTATASSPVGTYPITASGAADANYTISYVSGTLTVTASAPTQTTMTWATPAAITYGTALSSAQLDATASDPGAFSYSPASGAVLNAGSQTLSVTFTPSNNVLYSGATASTTLTVQKAPLTITANNLTMPLGGPLPTLTASYSGFVNGDTASSLTSPVTLSTTATAGSPAGTYPITASGAASGNYSISYVSGTLTVSGISAPTITWAVPAGIAYGTALSAAQLDATASVPGTFTYSPASGAVLAAGTQTLSVTFAPSNTALYSSTNASVSMTVAKAPLTITASNLTMVYGAAMPTLTCGYAGFVNGNTPSSLTTPVVMATDGAANSPVGAYWIAANSATSSNYAITFVSGTLTVKTAPLTITANNQTVVAGAALPTLTASYAGFVNGDTSASLTTQPALTTTATTNSAAGTYPITVSGAADANYSIAYVSGTLTVTAAQFTQTVLTWASPASITYGTALGAAQLNASASAPGTIVYSPASGTVLAAGTKTLTAVFTPSNSSLYTGATNTVSLTVSKAPLTITANNASKAYGAALPSFSATYAGFVNGDTASSLTTPVSLATTATSSSPAGSYSITASGAVDANYTISYVPGSLTVSSVPLTISANNQTMVAGTALPTLTASYAGFVNGDTSASLTTQPALTTTATTNSVAGTYPIIVSGAADANYAIAYVGGTLTVTAAQPTQTVLTWASPASITYGTALGAAQLNASASAPGTIVYSPASGTVLAAGTKTLTAVFTPSNSSLYTGATNTVSLTVSKAPLTITANNASKAYGAALPSFAASYAGFVNGDSATSLTTSASLATTATSSSPAGSYSITASGAVDANYTISYVAGILTVSSVPLTITANNQTMVAGAALPTLTASYAGFVNGDTSASLTTQPALTTTATTNSVAGTYPITVSGAADANYTIAYVGGTLTVTAAQPTQTVLTWASPASISYGTALGAAQLNASANAPGTFVYNPTAGTILAAGSKTLTVTFSPSNSTLYTGATTSVALTVSEAPLTITANNVSKVYGAAVPTLGCSYAGFVNGDTPASLTTPVVMATDGTSNSVVGSYWIAANSATSSNYTIIYIGAMLKVTPAPLVITANNQSMTAGSPLPALTASYSGFVLGNTTNNLTSQAALSTRATSSSPAGKYSITASGASAANYSISYVRGTLTITAGSRNALVPIVTSTGAALLPGGQMQINLSGQAGQLYVLDASSDLINWSPVVTNSLAAANDTFLVPISTNVTASFYRVDPSNP